MKNVDSGFVGSSDPVGRQLMVCGVLLAIAILGGMALQMGRGSDTPAATARPSPAPAGFVAHSAHYTLTADIHAGS